MEQDNISLQYGIHRTPSLGEDGELSECVNLIPQNGEMVNIQEPQSIGVELGSNESLLLIHRTFSGETNYIVQRKDTTTTPETWKLYWLRDSTYTEIPDTSFSNELDGNNITIIGNTLCVLSDDGIQYFIWRNETYEYLGDSLPQLKIEFALSTRFSGFVTGRYVDITNVQNWPTNAEIINAFYGKCNEASDEAIRNNEFTQPFLVRAAYRLYDGTIAMATAPCLLYPTDRVQPFGVAVSGSGVGTDYINVYSFLSKLKYRLFTTPNDLEKWQDIISSICIYVSAPLWSYNQSGDNLSIGAIYEMNGDDIIVNDVVVDSSGKVSTSFGDLGYGASHVQPFSQMGEFNARYSHHYVFPSTKSVTKQIKETDNFYLVSSISLADAEAYSRYCIYHSGFTDYYDVPMKEGTLIGLLSRERMSDNSISYDAIAPKKILTYNQRLVAYNLERRIEHMYLGNIIPFTDIRQSRSTIYYDGILLYTWPYQALEVYYRTKLVMNESITIEAYFIIDKNGKNIVVKSSEVTASKYGLPAFVFYPDTNAKAVVISENNGSTYYYREMRPHDFLDGAYAVLDSESWSTQGYSVITIDDSNRWMITETDPRYSQPNYLAYSESGQPFIFKKNNILTLDTDEILQISSATKALSQGQFGQFPLYAFANTGIWALEVNSEGRFSAKQPVSRDVCTNPDSVTQLDMAIVFVTNQGLKLIQGSDISLLSGPVEGLNLNETFIKAAVDGFADKFQLDSPFVSDDTQFVEQLQTARIVYDYAHNLLHVFHDQSSEPNRHYVYDFVSQQWSTQVLEEPLKVVVPGYPLSTMQFGNTLYQYDKTVDDTMRLGYLLTRPLSLGNPFARKLLYDLRVVGQRTQEDTTRRVAVYVSNDNVNWHRLSSLKALSAKYYRFLIMTHMCDIDTVSGLSIQYDYRFNRKMRGH